MASAARGKAMPRRVDEWRTQSAVRSLHGLHVPSPLLSSDDDDSDVERKKIQSCEKEIRVRDPSRKMAPDDDTDEERKKIQSCFGVGTRES